MTAGVDLQIHYAVENASNVLGKQQCFSAGTGSLLIV
jgi:hypothetical protein